MKNIFKTLILFTSIIAMSAQSQNDSSDSAAFVQSQYSTYLITGENVTQAGPYKAPDQVKNKEGKMVPRKIRRGEKTVYTASLKEPCVIHQRLASNVMHSRWLTPNELSLENFSPVFNERAEIACVIKSVRNDKTGYYDTFTLSALFKSKTSRDYFYYDFASNKVVPAWKQISTSDNPDQLVMLDLVNKIAWGPRSHDAMTFSDALAGANNFATDDFPAGCWRMPTNFGSGNMPFTLNGKGVKTASSSAYDVVLEEGYGIPFHKLTDKRSFELGARQVLPDMRASYHSKYLQDKFEMKYDDKWDSKTLNQYWMQFGTMEKTYVDKTGSLTHKPWNNSFAGERMFVREKNCGTYNGEGGFDPIAAFFMDKCDKLHFARYILKDECLPK